MGVRAGYTKNMVLINELLSEEQKQLVKNFLRNQEGSQLGEAYSLNDKPAKEGEEPDNAPSR